MCVLLRTFFDRLVAVQFITNFPAANRLRKIEKNALGNVMEGKALDMFFSWALKGYHKISCVIGDQLLIKIEGYSVVLSAPAFPDGKCAFLGPVLGDGHPPLWRTINHPQINYRSRRGSNEECPLLWGFFPELFLPREKKVEGDTKERVALPQKAKNARKTSFNATFSRLFPRLSFRKFESQPEVEDDLEF